MFNIFSTLILASAITAVIAHGPGELPPRHWKRDNRLARDALETKCGSQLAARRLKQSHYARSSILARRNAGLFTRATESNDSTCIITPEVTQGPYHILGEIIRQNITEGQAGVPLNISMNFVDIATCKPVQVWVDAWHANATGYYAGYITETSTTTGDGDGGGNMTMSGMPSMTSTSSATSTSASLGAYSGADSGGAQLSSTTDDNSTFLRGVSQSDEDGHLNMYSIIPGWYSGRAQHFHIKVYPEGNIAANGTFVVSGSAVHTGQFFFDNDTLTAVAATELYAANTIAWSDTVANEDDQWYPYQSALGYNANLDVTWVGDDIMDGLIGSITIGLNMSYESPETATAYADFDAVAYAASSLLPYASESASVSAFERMWKTRPWVHILEVLVLLAFQ